MFPQWLVAMQLVGSYDTAETPWGDDTAETPWGDDTAETPWGDNVEIGCCPELCKHDNSCYYPSGSPIELAAEIIGCCCPELTRATVVLN